MLIYIELFTIILHPWYVNICFEFISHTTVAKVVGEYEFFHRGESGGTYISSGFDAALDLIKEKYLM